MDERSKDCETTDQAGDVLESMNETLTSLLNVIMGPAFFMTLDGTVLSANKIVAELLGFCDEKELIGKNVYDLIPKEAAILRRIRISRVLESRKPIQFEENFSGFCFLNAVFPVLDTGGNVDRLAVFALDITQRKLMEEVRSESEKREKIAPEDNAGTEKDRAYQEDGSVLRKGDDSIVISTLNAPAQDKVLTIPTVGESAEGRKSEDSLGKVSERRDPLIGHYPIQISFLDAEGCYLLVNRVISKMFDRPILNRVVSEGNSPLYCPFIQKNAFGSVSSRSYRFLGR